MRGSAQPKPGCRFAHPGYALLLATLIARPKAFSADELDTMIRATR